TPGHSTLYLNRDSDNDVVIGSSSYTQRGLRVQSTGTSTFAGSVSVTGDVSATGTISAKYQDVAEWAPASEEMPSGTVVVVGASAPNTVSPSMHAYDTR